MPVHIVQRGRQRKAVFFEAEDYQAYLTWLGDAATKYDCQVHAYCLMTNHVHILASPAKTDGITKMMQFVGRHYVPFINRKYGWSGSIWEGRYKSSLIDAEDYLLACMRYIELNPVTAEMVNHSAKYMWSSYHGNANGSADALLTPHGVYQSLGEGEDRLIAYRRLFDAHQDQLNDAALEIRATSQTGTPLGNSRFSKQVEAALGVKVGQSRRGRPSGYLAKKSGR